jgi:hypothetical protein
MEAEKWSSHRAINRSGVGVSMYPKLTFRMCKGEVGMLGNT